MRKGDHAATAAALQRFSDHWFLDLAALEPLQGFAAFRESDQAKEWLARIAAEQKASKDGG